MQLHDRAVLAGSKLLVGSRFARAFIAIYALLLHAFVLLLLYHAMGPRTQIEMVRGEVRGIGGEWGWGNGDQPGLRGPGRGRGPVVGGVPDVGFGRRVGQGVPTSIIALYACIAVVPDNKCSETTSSHALLTLKSEP